MEIVAMDMKVHTYAHNMLIPLVVAIDNIVLCNTYYYITITCVQNSLAVARDVHCSAAQFLRRDL